MTHGTQGRRKGDSRGGGNSPPPPVFGRSVKHLSTRGTGEHINTCSPGFSYLPTPLYLSPLGYWTGVNWLSCKKALFRLLATHTSYSTTVSRKPLLGIGFWVLSSGLLKKGARFSYKYYIFSIVYTRPSLYSTYILTLFGSLILGSKM